MIQSFTDLTAWQVGMDLVQEVYALTKTFPPDERFGITSQLRRAVTGILANIAEGFSRRSPQDKAYKYTIARGECSETCAFLLMSIRLEHADAESTKRALHLCDRTGKLLSGLIQAHMENPTPDPRRPRQAW